MGLSDGASSSSGGGLSLGGGGAKSHAYIQYPPIRCDIPGAAGVMYDDGNKLLLVPAPNKVIPLFSHRLHQRVSSLRIHPEVACFLEMLNVSRHAFCRCIRGLQIKIRLRRHPV